MQDGNPHDRRNRGEQPKPEEYCDDPLLPHWELKLPKQRQRNDHEKDICQYREGCAEIVNLHYADTLKGDIEIPRSRNRLALEDCGEDVDYPDGEDEGRQNVQHSSQNDRWEDTMVSCDNRELDQS